MNNRLLLFCATMWLMGIVISNGISDADARVEAKRIEAIAIDQWTEDLSTAGDLPPEEKINLLGGDLRKVAELRIWPARDERIDTIYQSLQKELLSTPGHAEYYRDKVNEARRKMEEARGNIGDFASYRGDLQGVFRYDFPVLKNLPSPETVRVLGEFLSDERGYVRIDNPKDTNDLYRRTAESPAFGPAAEALLNLPLDDKPVAKTKYPGYFKPEDVQPWRKWYDEIKSGTRTFRFKGDPTEYDLNGPAPKDKLERISLTAKRDAERVARAAGRKPVAANATIPEPKKGNSPSTMPFIAGAFLALAAALYLVRLRKARWGRSR